MPQDIVKWAMCKLGVDEWLIDVVMSMYANATSSVRINGTLGEKFGVQVGVHQGSVLSPLLFIMALEALAREFRSGLPWELLYADDLVIIAESMEELAMKLEKWQKGMESKGLRVNTKKTKVMICGYDEGPVLKSGKWPCGVCRKGVGSNSILCTFCNCWIHACCSDIHGHLSSVVDFKCKTCAQEVHELTRPKEVMMGENVYEVVDQFCYLGDMISAGGGAEASSVSWVRSGWKKFRELLPLLTSRVFSLKTKGQLYAACVRSAMVYGSETWAAKEDDM